MTNPVEPSAIDLKAAHCWTSVDSVPNDSEMTTFKRTARYRQALWRDEQGLPIGTHRVNTNRGVIEKPNGTKIDQVCGESTGANFLTSSARRAAEDRLENPEPHQTLDERRLWTDLLSSMPMCFNLFGDAWADKASGRAPDALGIEGKLVDVRFAWSPGRCDRALLNNRTAFDVALLVENGAGLGVIGVETKYHAHAVAETAPRRHDDPTKDRLNRYEEVHHASGVFVKGALEQILGTDLQQLWLDHLLVLSMLQHPSNEWAWGRSILVAPARNTSFADAADRYRGLLTDDMTFQYRTIDSLLDAGLLPPDEAEAFRERYLW